MFTNDLSYLCPMNINTNSLLEYFKYFISVQSSLMDRRYKLTPREQEYLAECAAYHCEGGNLHDFEEISGYLISRGVVANPKECSVYKNRLSIKKWIDTGRGRFRLPASLSAPKGYDLRIQFNGGDTRGGDRSVQERGGAGVHSDGHGFVPNLERRTNG